LAGFNNFCMQHRAETWRLYCHADSRAAQHEFIVVNGWTTTSAFHKVVWRQS